VAISSGGDAYTYSDGFVDPGDFLLETNKTSWSKLTYFRDSSVPWGIREPLAHFGGKIFSRSHIASAYSGETAPSSTSFAPQSAMASSREEAIASKAIPAS